MGDWRALADEALRDRNTRDNRNESPPIVPSVPSVPANPSRLLKRWHGKLAALDLHNPPEGLEWGQWAQLCDDSWWLYENFASVAVRQGWGAQGLWGVRAGYPAGGGLAQFLRSSRSVVFMDGIAHVSLRGVTSKLNPMCGDGLPLIWELKHD